MSLSIVYCYSFASVRTNCQTCSDVISFRAPALLLRTVIVARLSDIKHAVV